MRKLTEVNWNANERKSPAPNCLKAKKWLKVLPFGEDPCEAPVIASAAV
jgi:hypothetical protein